MRFSKFLQLLLVIAAAAGLHQCTEPAPHSNPLDPQSPKYSDVGAIAGRCHRLYDAAAPVADVRVTLTLESSGGAETEWITTTDSTGRFTFNDLHPNRYRLTFLKPGFTADTLRLTLEPRQIRNNLSVAMDALPVLQNARLTTGHQFLTGTGAEQFLVQFEAQVHDPDRNLDLDGVTCSAEAIGLQSHPLQPSTDRTLWSTEIALDSLGITNPDDLLGVPFYLDVSSNANSATRISRFGPFRIVRFIPSQLLITAPKNDTTVTSPINFRWTVSNPPRFPFTYVLEVNQIISFGDFITYRVTHSGPETSLNYGFGLSPGRYFWVVKLVDRFGNWSQSREETFNLQR